MKNRFGFILMPALVLLIQATFLLQRAEACPTIQEFLRSVVAANGVGPSNPEGFTRTRNLLEYLRLLPPDIGERIANMGPRHLILDAGSGESVAAEELFMHRLETLLEDEHHELYGQGIKMNTPYDPYSALSKIGRKKIAERPNVLAVTHRLDRKIDYSRYENKFKVLPDEFFEEISTSKLGKPNLILDIGGVMAYTDNPTAVLKKYMEILHEDGEVLILLDKSKKTMAVTSDGIVNPHSGQWENSNLNRWTVKMPDGKTIDFMQWCLKLRRYGLEVEPYGEKSVFTKLNHPPYFAQEIKPIGVRIRRKKGTTFNPPELEFAEPPDVSRNPPSRHFRQIP